MASVYDLGQGLGRLFQAAQNADAVRQAAYDQAVRQQLADRLLQAKVADQDATDTAYANMPSDLEQIGFPAGQGRAYAEVARATGSKANQLGDLVRRMLQVGYLKGAQDALSRGDTLAANFGLSAGGARPLEMTRVQGDVAFNPNVTPGAASQQLMMTPAARVMAAQRAPKTFVGSDGVLRVVHPDGTAQVVRDRGGEAVRQSDVTAASAIYGRIYSGSLSKPPFAEWYNSVWPQLKAGTVRKPAAETSAPQNAPMDPAQRTIGVVYMTPRGPLKWVGNGWLPPQ